MNTDPASLDKLIDIVVAPPVSWWPPAIGWWFVVSLLLIGAAVAAFRRWRTWKANAYRRQALNEMETAKGIVDISAILKRTALVTYRRTDVASLSGLAWTEWLRQTTDESLPANVSEALSQGVFTDDRTGDVAEVKAYASKWICTHREQTSQST